MIKLIDKIPASFGVYLMKNEEGKVLYVGKAKNLKDRVRQYFVPGRDSRPLVPYLVAEIKDIDFILVTSEKEALLLENNLIKKHRPKYNALLKDDKSYFSIAINHKHLWPMMRLVRFKGKPPSGSLYFGPYTNGWAAKQTLKLLRQLFPLRQCSDHELVSRTRPCILYGLKRCIAPCVAKCTKEEYDVLVKKVIEFLRGHDRTIIKDLQVEMKQAVAVLEFEKAALILKKIEYIESTLEKQRVEKAGLQDIDVLNLFREEGNVIITQMLFREGKLMGSYDYYFPHNLQEDDELFSSFLLQHYEGKELLPDQIIVPILLKNTDELSSYLDIKILHPKRGDKVELLEMAKKNARAAFNKEKISGGKERILLSLEEQLRLLNFPERIECFDNSHISGSEPVSCMIVYENGMKDTSSYRRYKIKQAAPSDDYGALREVLERRYSKAKEEDNLPDMILIDGGKGHLNIARGVLSELDITTVDLVAISKEESKHTKGLTAERLFTPAFDVPFILPKDSPLLLFLQSVRDEAHRFVITFQKERRKKKVFKSALDDLPGIGPIKKKRLLNHFGSVAKIIAATAEELLNVPGINKKDVETIQSLNLN